MPSPGIVAQAPTSVVNVRSGEPFDIYIGRRMSGRGWPESIWANPFKIDRDGTREEVIEKYHQRLMSRPDLLAKIPELRGMRLGCWCAPYACHGDVLAEIANGLSEAAS